MPRKQCKAALEIYKKFVANMEVVAKFLAVAEVDYSQSVHLLWLTKARFPLAELTARVDGWPFSITRQHGPCWRAVLTARQLG